ncbi:hypothetical protein KO561_12930 [Radiobacillus kanasensis]|uniref:hypothetical protein n=1 Tax=Radiobacillus kanasensis TaxID=2844358 RepID=UPI001E2D5F7C|nr:hypothetical protein [Radiobacillus kanasensis]UFT98106.1 hypothetical protein KO561_12930 [Radiobacillus kanasensis]
MADQKSSEGMVTYKCMKCFAEMSVCKRRESRMDGRSCFLCRGPIQNVENKESIGSLTVDVDCSDALKGLKAIQREAKKATAALKELEGQQEKIGSKDLAKSIYKDIERMIEQDRRW